MNLLDHKINSPINCLLISSGTIEEKTEKGLVKAHAYSVTGVAVVNGTQLIRVRNPWGNEREWNGHWSDESDEWNKVSTKEKAELGVTYDHDGEFWMSFKDFICEFSQFTICHKLSCDTESNMHFSISEREGSWVKGVSAGGCRNYPETFGTNPQYRVTLTDPDPDDEDDDDACLLIVSLMQKNSRGYLHSPLSIGFMIYPLDDDAYLYFEDDDRIAKKYFWQHKSCGSTPRHKCNREILGTFWLPAGEYVIIPSTYEPNEEGDFYLRLLTETSANKIN